MSSLIYACLLAFLGIILGSIVIPVLRKIASPLGLIDKPNGRKQHQGHVPVIGGIGVFLTALTTLAIISPQSLLMHPGMLQLSMACLLLITGVVDDRFDIPAWIKLVIQLAIAMVMVSQGFSIKILHGFFGFHELSTSYQLLLSTLLITGAINAFNLMDGIDGLAGLFALIGLLVLGVLALMQYRNQDAFILFSMIGAVAAFLRFNLGKNKVFMGDGGSLFLGFILVTSAFQAIQASNDYSLVSPHQTMLGVLGIFIIPVWDSLRVYRLRIKNGQSPFKADRSHIHHLFLKVGLNPKKVSYILACTNILLVTLLLLGSILVPTGTAFIVGSLVFFLLAKILRMNQGLQDWSLKIKDFEQLKPNK